jgi:hypothetical protein
MWTRQQNLGILLEMSCFLSGWTIIGSLERKLLHGVGKITDYFRAWFAYTYILIVYDHEFQQTIIFQKTNFYTHFHYRRITLQAS